MNDEERKAFVAGQAMTPVGPVAWLKGLMGRMAAAMAGHPILNVALDAR